MGDCTQHCTLYDKVMSGRFRAKTGILREYLKERIANLLNINVLAILNVGMRRQHVLRLKFIIFVILLHKCLNYKRNRN